MLSEKNDLCIISGNTKEMIVRFLSAYGLQNLFSAVYDKNDAGTKEEKILHALGRYRSAETGSYMIGDALSDMPAAKNAGIISIAAAWGNLNRHILAEGNPDYIAEKPEYLLTQFS